MNMKYTPLAAELKQKIDQVGTDGFFAALADALKLMSKRWPDQSKARQLFRQAADVTLTTRRMLGIGGTR